MAAVGARDAYYWDRPLPGVELREAQLETPVRVVVGGKTYDVKPAEALRVDAAATQQALWNAGRTSFVGRMRTIVDPSPPARVVDQVLVARPEVDEVAARVSAALPKPRRAQVVVRDGLEVIPARPGDGVDARRLGASLAKASLTGARTLSPALTHVEPELTTSAAQAAVDEATSLIDEPVTLEFKGEDVGTLDPARLVKLAPLPSRRRELPHLVPSAACRQGGRADGRAMAYPRRQRPLRRRRQAGSRAALASGARCRRPLGRRRDRRRRRRACAPRRPCA